MLCYFFVCSFEKVGYSGRVSVLIINFERHATCVEERFHIRLGNEMYSAQIKIKEKCLPLPCLLTVATSFHDSSPPDGQNKSRMPIHSFNVISYIYYDNII